MKQKFQVQVVHAPEVFLVPSSVLANFDYIPVLNCEGIVTSPPSRGH